MTCILHDLLVSSTQIWFMWNSPISLRLSLKHTQAPTDTFYLFFSALVDWITMSPVNNSKIMTSSSHLPTKHFGCKHGEQNSVFHLLSAIGRCQPSLEIYEWSLVFCLWNVMIKRCPSHFYVTVTMELALWIPNYHPALHKQEQRFTPTPTSLPTPCFRHCVWVEPCPLGSIQAGWTGWVLRKFVQLNWQLNCNLQKLARKCSFILNRSIPF